ncbi:hypothetical protein BJF80_04900 [Serinicoccus sp. CUA-874]|uniref:hypothetical protein n=1 Tax=Serinicoccus sp. CUA-874 TaxID=1517939 RepID=UPI00095AF5F3|nr:hypothetical protein [Serinicoccus sp. CUA-874]OLT16683.1 hypothetical protein BJF80_04900 [Serinicoccus sp. CUA-874]
MITDLTAQPIRFTSDLPAWQRLLETLGGHLVYERPGWLVYAVGSGRVALHAASEQQPAGVCALALSTTTPVPEAVAAAAAAGVPITLGHPDHGEAGMVEAPDGTSFTLDSPTPVEREGGVSDRRLAALPIWYGPDTAMITGVLEGIGARPRTVADDRIWTDLRCEGGGLVAAHRDESPAVELAFEWDGDVEEALALLTEAGIEAVLIDETYSRTVQIADPDGRKEIWVNERMTDLYGYTRT